MQPADENLRFYVWSELSPTSSASGSERTGSASQLSSNIDSSHAHPLPTCHDALGSGQAVPMPSGVQASETPPSNTPSALHSFYLPEQEREVSSLLSGISNARNRELLHDIITDVESDLALDPKCVDPIVILDGADFHCPGTFASSPQERCLKRPGGWSCVRNVREHIWIDHLGRRLGCTQDGCQITFGREQERDTHVNDKHLGKGQIFPCDICGKTFPKKGNHTRHQSTHNKSSCSPKSNDPDPDQASTSG